MGFLTLKSLFIHLEIKEMKNISFFVKQYAI